MYDLDRSISEQIINMPNRPGCYLMKDIDGNVLYIGKATNIRTRVRSYFHNSAQHSPRTRELVRNISSIDWIIQKSELESLLLEYNLIARHKPKYNVRWKDDKRYPYIKVHWGDRFPKITVTRNRIQENDGHRYFGPYTNIGAIRQSLDLLRKIFPYLTCDRVITGADQRACLYWDINLCNAPCTGNCSEQEYRMTIDNLCSFLQGRTQTVSNRIRDDMRTASKMQMYEKAAMLRDQLNAIDRIVAKQQVISSNKTDMDVIALARQKYDACVQVFFVRMGKLIGREYFLLEGTADENNKAILAAFVKQFYHVSTFIPREILLPDCLSESQVIEQWLNGINNKSKTKLIVPQRGPKRNLVLMAAENASATLEAIRAQWHSDTQRQEVALAELKSHLMLPKTPNRIECFDISHTQGTQITGSMVVFHRGAPDKAHYRRFTIRTVDGPDDYASMREVLVRRFRRLSAYHNTIPEIENLTANPSESFAQTPDLLLIDGGKGHLSVTLDVLQKLGLEHKISVAAISKQNEELHLPGQNRAILLSAQSSGMFLVQRIRDEAHRFASQHHRLRRKKSSITSQLERVPGIGPKRRKSLLRHFGSLEQIREASLAELTEADGMNIKYAQAVKDAL
jgi:excinuclease ABC subunit C